MVPVTVFDTPELLCMIFVSLLSEDVDDDAELPIHSPLRAPVVLTQVCRNWRRAALAYPTLWSKLLLTLKASMFVGDGGLARPCAVLKKWLERSRQLPFTLKITYESDIDPEPCTCCRIKDPTLDGILMLNSRRWKELDIEIEFEKLPLVLFYPQLLTLDLPELRTVAICNPSDGTLTTPFDRTHAPKLEMLTLFGSDVELNAFVADCHLPPTLRFFELRNMTFKFDTDCALPNITSIHFVDVAICTSDFAKFPDFFPLLEDLEILSHLIEYKYEEVRDFVVLENLRSFKASCYDRYPVQSISAPKLRHLALENEFWDTDSHTTFSDIHSLVERSSPPLEILHIDGLAIKSGAFAPFLDLVPGLKEIKIIHAPTTVHMLKAIALPVLKQGGTFGPRCPDLYKFECNLVLITDESPEELREMEIEILSVLMTSRLLYGTLPCFEYPWADNKKSLVMARVHSLLWNALPTMTR